MARVYDVGQGVWAENFFSHNGAPTDPTDITLRWRVPDGTVTSFTKDDLERAELGRFRKSFTLSQSGVYVANWASTGAVVAADEVIFTVMARGIDGYLLAFYGANPDVVPRDQVRLLVGDTDARDFLLLDAEIDWLLDRALDDLTQASIQAALAIAAKLSRDVDRSLGDVSRSASQRATAYRDLAAALTEQAKRDRVLAKVSKAPIARSGNLNASDEGGYFYMGMFDPGSRPPRAGGDRRAGF